jgi:hypothetical protein
MSIGGSWRLSRKTDTPSLVIAAPAADRLADDGSRDDRACGFQLEDLAVDGLRGAPGSRVTRRDADREPAVQEAAVVAERMVVQAFVRTGDEPVERAVDMQRTFEAMRCSSSENGLWCTDRCTISKPLHRKFVALSQSMRPRTHQRLAGVLPTSASSPSSSA